MLMTAMLIIAHQPHRSKKVMSVCKNVLASGAMHIPFAGLSTTTILMDGTKHLQTTTRFAQNLDVFGPTGQLL